MADSTVKGKRTQPAWQAPGGEGNVQLKLYNSLTRQKEVFVPQSGKRVLWYSCGPTVYDASHMGHARSYISFDILRRVMTDYFKYDVFYCMNVTDIDDKIIVRARQNYLLQQYVERQDTAKQVLADIKEAMIGFEEKVEGEADKDKKAMLSKARDTIRHTLSTLEQAGLPEGHQQGETKQMLIDTARDVLMGWLDKKYGSGVTDNSIFSELPKHWEQEFHTDMDSLQVLPADVLTRVSEYIPEVIAYVQKIMDNGYGYESKGSVYFDTAAFDSKDSHHYAKLVPEAFGDKQALSEGEGELSVTGQGEKRSANDFALWKASKPGEPSWDSPWGKGRPGWHIECSAMASCILGESMDIHSGGFDLKFPHHDNELAQAEAHFENDHWVRYFLHTGHLKIEGCKMSKSLKNTVSVGQMLDTYTPNQFRMLCLLTHYRNSIEFSKETMEKAVVVMTQLNSLVTQCDAYVQGRFDCPYISQPELYAKIHQTREAAEKAFADDFNTPRAMEAVLGLMKYVNQLMSHKMEPSGVPRSSTAVVAASVYIRRVLKQLGLDLGRKKTEEDTDAQRQFQFVMNSMTGFRSRVRNFALDSEHLGKVLDKHSPVPTENVSSLRKDLYSPLLDACDDVREQLASANIQIKDIRKQSTWNVEDRKRSSTLTPLKTAQTV